MATLLGLSEFPSSFHWNQELKETLNCRFVANSARNLTKGGARLRRAVPEGDSSVRKRRMPWVDTLIFCFVNGKASWCLPGSRDARPTCDVGLRSVVVL
jgi:hypothetical protein